MKKQKAEKSMNWDKRLEHCGTAAPGCVDSDPWGPPPPGCAPQDPAGGGCPPPPVATNLPALLLAAISLAFLALAGGIYCANGPEFSKIPTLQLALDSYYNRCKISTEVALPSSEAALLRCYRESTSCPKFKDCLARNANSVDDDNDSADDDVVGETWTDSSSGFTWQVTPSDASLTWSDAISYCETLSLAGGGWHLPTISELRTLIRGCDGTTINGSCGVVDSCLESSCQDASCLSCSSGGGPNDGCYAPPELSNECNWYWSSSSVSDDSSYAWIVKLSNAGVGVVIVSDSGEARCVR
jgi:hypothetical protein